MNTDFLRNNSITKVVAVISALFLWLFVINDGFRVDFLESPLEVSAVNVTPSLALAADIEDVKIKVRAPLSAWASIDVDDFTATVNLNKLSEGQHEIPVKVTASNPEIQIVDVDPKTIVVEIGEIITEEKEIAVMIQGQPGEDYTAAEPKVGIEKVSVTGARTVLEELNEIIAFIDVSGAMSTVTKTSELLARGVNDKKLRVSIDPKTIEITVPINRQADVKIVGVKVNTAGSLSAGQVLNEVNVEPSVVTIQGKEDILKNISFIETESIDLSALSKGDTLNRKLILLDGVELVDGDDSAIISVDVEDIIKSKIIDITARGINLGAGLSVRINPPRARLILEGSDSVLSSATDKTIKVTIDLSGRGPGKLILPVTESLVTLPEGVSIKDIETKQFEIIIE